MRSSVASRAARRCWQCHTLTTHAGCGCDALTAFRKADMQEHRHDRPSYPSQNMRTARERGAKQHISLLVMTWSWARTCLSVTGQSKLLSHPCAMSRDSTCTRTSCDSQRGVSRTACAWTARRRGSGTPPRSAQRRYTAVRASSLRQGRAKYTRRAVSGAISDLAVFVAAVSLRGCYSPLQ